MKFSNSFVGDLAAVPISDAELDTNFEGIVAEIPVYSHRAPAGLVGVALSSRNL